MKSINMSHLAINHIILDSEMSKYIKKKMTPVVGISYNAYFGGQSKCK